jgi:hypothetical protein
MSSPSLRCTAFSGPQRIASGELRHVAMKAKQAFDLHPDRPVLVFDDADARTIEVPLELPAADLLRLLAQPQLSRPAPRPHRPRANPAGPKLGVVAREITLLPRHWDWLAAQPGGASVALRRLVEEARKVSAGEDRRRAAQEATFRFMQAMAGDAARVRGGVARAVRRRRRPASRSRWRAGPDDVRDHALWLATDAFGS